MVRFLYADEVTDAMQAAMEETERRRQKQLAFNEEHGIKPETIRKAIRQGIELELRAHRTAKQVVADTEDEFEVSELIAQLEKEMLEAAENLQFEKAASLRDRLKELKESPQTGKVKRSDAEPKAKPGTPGAKKKGRGKKRSASQ
jgi:excinuclease ABC subunit B